MALEKISQRCECPDCIRGRHDARGLRVFILAVSFFFSLGVVLMIASEVISSERIEVLE